MEGSSSSFGPDAALILYFLFPTSYLYFSFIYFYFLFTCFLVLQRNWAGGHRVMGREVGSDSSWESRNGEGKRLMLRWKSGMGAIFGLEKNMHPKAAFCTKCICLVQAWFALPQHCEQKLN